MYWIAKAFKITKAKWSFNWKCWRRTLLAFRKFTGFFCFGKICFSKIYSVPIFLWAVTFWKRASTQVWRLRVDPEMIIHRRWEPYLLRIIHKSLVRIPVPKLLNFIESNKQETKGDSRSGSVGRAVASNTRGPLFKTSHWQNLYLHLYTVNCIE